MSLNVRLFAGFSSEMLCLSELRNALKTRKKPLFDELEKDALCLFQLRKALFI